MVYWKIVPNSMCILSPKLYRGVMLPDDGTPASGDFRYPSLPLGK